jgi:hypothetical protein
MHDDVPGEPGIRWHLLALPTTLPRLVLRTQASRMEKGCPYITTSTLTGKEFHKDRKSLLPLFYTIFMQESK